MRQLTDSGTDLNNIEKEMGRRLGRPLTDSERVGLLARVDPTHQASTMVEEMLGPALRDIKSAGGQSALDDFHGQNGLVENRTNKSVAEGQAKLAEQNYLEGGIPQNTTRRLDEAQTELERVQQEHAQALADQRAVDLGVHQTQQSRSLNAAGSRVSDAQAALDEAVANAHDAAGAHAEDQKLRSPSGQLIRTPEQRDLIIAESDARRANAAYDRLAARDEHIPIAPQGQNNAVRQTYERRLASAARQAGYAEDRASRLRQALGENVTTREQAVRDSAQAAGQAARERAYAPPTPELAGAKVRLRYEQQNLQRLQNQKAAGQQGLVDNLARAFQKVNKAQRDVDVATRDLPEAAKAQGWAQLTGRDFAGPDGTTVHYQDVVDRLQELEDKYRDNPKAWDAMQRGLDATQNVRTTMLDEKVAHGIIGDDARKGMLDTYDFWTPTNMTDYLNDTSGKGLPKGSRFNVSSPGIRSYTPEGSSMQHENHVAALIREVYAHKSQVAKNDVASALVKGLGSDSTVMRKIADSVEEYNAAGGKAGKLLHPDYTLRGGEQKIVGLANGKAQQYVTNNKLLKTAIEQVGASGDGSLAKALASVPASIVRELAVQRNPGFLPMNLARDTIAYAIRNSADLGAGGVLKSTTMHLGPAALTAAMTDHDDPNRGEKIAAALLAGRAGRLAIGKGLGLGPSATNAFMRAFGDSLKGLGTGQMTGEGVRALEASGAGMRGGGVFSAAGPLETIGRAIRGDTRPLAAARAEDELQRLTKGNYRDLLTLKNGDALKSLLGDVAGNGWVKALGNRFEQAPRVATYRLALERGATPLEAMIKARDVTTDFNRGGRFTRELNRYIPFLNVGAQAPAQLGRLLKDHPGGALMAGLSLLGAPAAATEAWNYADPQRAKDYEDTPDYLKKLGITLMVPGEAPRDAQGNRTPQKIFIPIPNEFMPFVEAGREGFHRVQDARGLTDQGHSSSLGDLLGKTSELSPINANSPEGAVYGEIPPPIGTIPQLASNRDVFRGTTIANQFSDENSSNLGKVLAPILESAITKLPGQSSARIHPSQVDFAVKDMLQGTGQEGLNISDALSGRAARVAGTASELPLVGSVASRFVRGTGGQSWEDVRQPDAMLSPELRQQFRDHNDYWEPTAVPSDIQKVPLTREEQVQYQKLTNQYLDTYLRRVMAMPSFDRSDAARTALRTEAMDDAREKAGADVLRQVRASGGNLSDRYRNQSSAY